MIVFNDKIEEMQKDLFLNNKVNLLRLFRSYDGTNKGFLTIFELKELFSTVMDKEWASNENLIMFCSKITRRDMGYEEGFSFHFGDFLKIFSGSHAATQNSMHNMFLWG